MAGTGKKNLNLGFPGFPSSAHQTTSALWLCCSTSELHLNSFAPGIGSAGRRAEAVVMRKAELSLADGRGVL